MEQESLALKAQQGDLKAQDRLIIANGGLIIKMANRLATPYYSSSELVQEGCIGMIAAIESFEPAKGKFLTYATWYVKGAMKHSIRDNSRTVRIPHVAQVLIKKYILGTIESNDITEADINNYNYESNTPIDIHQEEFTNNISISLDKVLSDIESSDTRRKLIAVVNNNLDSYSANILLSYFGLWNGIATDARVLAKQYNIRSSDIELSVADSIELLASNPELGSLFRQLKES